MKTFTVTPKQFQTGEAVRMAADSSKNRKPRKPGKPKPHGPSQERQIGTITPEDFGVGRPFWGHRAHLHRTGPVPALKPLPEAIVDHLLEAGPDDPEAFLRSFEPAPLELILSAYKEVLALPYDDKYEFYTRANRIVNDMVAKLEKATGRMALEGTKEMLGACAPKPWNDGKITRGYAREILGSFKNCSKRVK